MRSSITSKFQTTIPKKIRQDLSLSIHDTIEWQVERGRAVVKPVKNPFLKHRNAIHTGGGDIATDIKRARRMRTKKFT